jgi:ribonuclease P protein component
VQTEHSGLPKTNAFGKNVRLRNAAEFRQVYEKGAKRISRSFVLFAMCNGLSFSRFGLTAPRNSEKRTRETGSREEFERFCERLAQTMPVGFDFVVNPRRPAGERPLLNCEQN